MAALPFPKYGIDKLYLFPAYATPEAYQQATGLPCPAWDQTRRPKYWFDPSAQSSTEDFILYDHVLATNMKDIGQPLVGADGKPFLKSLVLPREVAATVNIPPNTASIPGAAVPEYPVPVRALESNEELFFDLFNIVTVRNKDLTPAVDTGFTAADRGLLQGIAKKLGV